MNNTNLPVSLEYTEELHKLSWHRNHCIGKQNGCDDYGSIISFLKE